LAETRIQSILVTKIARAPVLAIATLNVLFALLGLSLGIVALVVDSESVSAVQRGLGVEGLVASLLENGGGIVEGKEVEEFFNETGDNPGDRVALRINDVQWQFTRFVGGSQADQMA
jgi:hypothetical protein